MSVETKKMSNSIAVGSLGERLKSWPEKVRSFYSEVRTEMRKVTAPTLKDVRATTTVVIITVFLFALYFGIIDFIIQHAVTAMFSYFRVH
ncbi:MAG: preprotein translocase subunit SecE [Candidatus Sulfotelmatobacter sp.]